MKKKWLALLFALIMGLTIGVSQASAEIMVSPGTIGDVLLFSLYDVREDTDFRTSYWDNFLVIENTSGNWTAVHLRFRAYKKSIEVWDHVILLSPYDMFWADLYRTPGGGVTIWSNDENTLTNSGLYYGTPVSPNRLWEDQFSTDLMVACGFPDLLSETEMGEIEVIGLWQLNSPTGGEDTHDVTQLVRDLYQDPYEASIAWNGINVYDLMFGGYYEFDPFETAWPTVYTCQQSPQPNTDLFWNAGWETYADSEVWINPCEAPQGNQCATNPSANICDGTPRDFDDLCNVLTGAFEMGDVGNGRYELQNFVVLRDFRTNEEGWTDGRTDELNGLHRDRFGGGEIMFPPTVMWDVIEVAAYTASPWGVPMYRADGRFSGAVTDIPAYYLNESWSSTYGAGLRDGDNCLALNANVFDPGVVAPFNDIWSLDDTENALSKSAVWFHYFNDFLYEPGVWDYRYITDISVSFPTKHYHWFFLAFPWWQNPYPDEQPSTYADYIIQFREKIADTFEWLFDNGRVLADSYIWDDDENLYEPPPGSGPSPITHKNVVIPHEVNYIRVQTTDPDGLLYIDPALNYTIGHFKIDNIRTTNGLRLIGFDPGEHPIYRPTTALDYKLYPVGAVTFLNFHVDPAGDPDGLIRSTLSNWHYVWTSIHPIECNPD
jgi:hypothetical protein